LIFPWSVESSGDRVGLSTNQVIIKTICKIGTILRPLKCQNKRIMKVKELLKVLYDDGWLDKTQKGSHLQLIHEIKEGKVTVPIHGGDIPKGTLNSILKQAGLK
jgi:predicted RNA binding protein YcfA (HicA-like mRNA interferase family)